MYTDETKLGGAGRGFPETVGGLVDRLADGPADARRAAAEELCLGYWKPVYHWLRLTWTKTNEDAKDLTQAFFLWVLEDGPLERYVRERGRFRSFLRSLLQHFVQHDDEARRRLKRGGHLRALPLDPELPDPRETDPDRAFDGAWRAGILERAVGAVRAAYQGDGKAVRFRAFEEYDMAPPDARPNYAELGRRLGVRETDVHNHLVRVREDVRAAVREELARTLSNPADLDEEWRDFVRDP